MANDAAAKPGLRPANPQFSSGPCTKRPGWTLEALRDAVARARLYVRAAIAAAPGYGRGHGPLDHGVTVAPERIPPSV